MSTDLVFGNWVNIIIFVIMYTAGINIVPFCGYYYFANH